MEISFEIRSIQTMKSGEKLIHINRRLEDKSTESKIVEFGSRFAHISTSEVDRNF